MVRRALCLLVVVSFARADDHPLARDHTGIRWVRPFSVARARAAERKRLLLVKPAAFGTFPDGSWSPEAEVLRAGPLSDERVRRLVNRRFVPVYFDLAADGLAADADARAFVLARAPELGAARVATPSLFVLTPDGQEVARIGNYSSARQMLDKLRAALAERPEYGRPSDEERAATHPLDRARVRFDLGDLAGARELLAGERTSAAAYVRGRIARFLGEWGAMEAEFALVADDELADDVRVERAWRLWREGDFAGLAAHLDGFPANSPRATEARYLEGLAHFHLKNRDRAREIWRTAVETRTPDPWIYKADWALDTVLHAKSGKLTTTRPTPLRPRGYRGRPNPDLMRRLSRD